MLCIDVADFKSSLNAAAKKHTEFAEKKAEFAEKKAFSIYFLALTNEPMRENKYWSLFSVKLVYSKI